MKKEKFSRTQELAYLAVKLLCNGIQIDCSKDSMEMRPIVKRRAGLGSGIEIIIEGKKRFWINVPVEESFVANTPYRLICEGKKFYVSHPQEGKYLISLPPLPKWYDMKTSRGIEMPRIGVLQGSYLGIYVGKCCQFWKMDPPMACHFCATGQHVGIHEELEKTVEDVVETALMAKKESNVSFVHFNSGYQEEKDVETVYPFVKAVKKDVGALVGVQIVPPKDPKAYRPLIQAGVDHFSLCYELHNPKFFAKYLPGKEKFITQERFFRALEYLCKNMPKGSVSGEIIAGMEPMEDTKQAIDYISSIGAFPTVCIFRPLKGAVLENAESPKETQMIEILRYTALKCLQNGIPIGLAPNLEVSLVMTPEDCRYLLPRNASWYFHHYKLKVLKTLARPIFALKMARKEI